MKNEFQFENICYCYTYNSVHFYKYFYKRIKIREAIYYKLRGTLFLNFHYGQ